MNIFKEIEAGVHDDVLEGLSAAIANRQFVIKEYDYRREAIIDEIN